MQNLDITSRAPDLQPPSSLPAHAGRQRAAGPTDSGTAQPAEVTAPDPYRIPSRAWRRTALALGQWIVRTIVTLLAVCQVCPLTLHVAAQSISPVQSRSLTESYGRLPLSFEPNVG